MRWLREIPLKEASVREKRGFSEKMGCKEMLQTRAISRDAPLEKVNSQEKPKITLNVTNHPVFWVC